MHISLHTHTEPPCQASHTKPVRALACHHRITSSGPHRSASTFHLMANWFRDKEALWCSTRPLLSFISRPPVVATLLPQRIAAYGKPASRHSVIFIPPMWRQHFCRSALLHMASLCHSIRPSSGPHRSASTFHLMANWFRDKEALWCCQPQSVTPDHRLIVLSFTG